MIAERDFAGRSWQGMRDYQEDSYLFCPLKNQRLIVVVADGMGGHRGGNLASQSAVKTFAESCHDADTETEPTQLLHTALLEANQKVSHLNSSQSKDDLAGCTLVAALQQGENLWFISVGDSPLLLYREGKIYRLNSDHSMRAQLQTKLLFGKITAEEYQGDRTKSMLLSALTGDQLDLIDSPAVPRLLQPEDILLVATDGLLTVGNDEIEAVCQSNDNETMEALATSIMNLVKERSGSNQDNTTITAFRYSPSLL